MTHPLSHKLGRLPLPIDERDFHVSLLAAYDPHAQETMTRRFWTMGGHDMRMDQGEEGTCEGHSHTNLLIAGPIVHPTFPPFETVDKAHTFARKLYYDSTGDDTYQEGAYTRQILRELLRRGQIGSYAAMNTADEVVNTLLSVGPVCHGSLWYNSQFDPIAKYNNFYVKVDTTTGIAGGHSYCLTAVELAPPEGPPYVRIENSWGPTWGKNGTARLAITDLHKLFEGDAFVVSEQTF